MKQLKRKLGRIEEAINSLEMLNPEQQVGAIGMLDDAFEKLLLMDDGNISEGITTFYNKVDELDAQLDKLEKQSRDVYKEKLEWYKKGYNKLKEDLWSEAVDFKAIDETLEKQK